MAFYRHPNSIVESTQVGARTEFCAFCHVLPDAVVGEDCTICDHVFIENGVVIGDRVTVKCGVRIGNGVTLEDDVFIGPNVTFASDLLPGHEQRAQAPTRTLIRKGAVIGANATILAGTIIGTSAMVRAGAVVTKDVPSNAIVVGNPAHIEGYVPSDGRGLSPQVRPSQVTVPVPVLDVEGVELIDLPLITDLRGSLSFAELWQQLPFPPKRYFLVFDVPGKDVRGEHAHRTLQQLLVCAKGSCSVLVDDGRARAEVCLDRPNLGLYLPPMVWAVQYKYTEDAVLLVLASDIYKPEDYIRDYDAFLQEVGRKA